MGVAIMVALFCAPFLAIPAALISAVQHYRTRDERAEWKQYEQRRQERREAFHKDALERYPEHDKWMEESGVEPY